MLHPTPAEKGAPKIHRCLWSRKNGKSQMSPKKPNPQKIHIQHGNKKNTQGFWGVFILLFTFLNCCRLHFWAEIQKDRELLSLEVTSGDHLVQFHDQSRSSRTSCSPGMLAPEPLWVPCSSVNYLYGKNGCFFCLKGISSIIFSSLPLVFYLDGTEETLSLFILLSSIRYLYKFIASPLSSLD